MVLLAKSLLTALMLTASSNSSFASDLDIHLSDSIAVDKFREMMAVSASINTVKNTTICQAMMRFIDQSQPSGDFDKEKFRLACMAYGFITKWHQDFPEQVSETDDTKTVSSTSSSEKRVHEEVGKQSEPSKSSGDFRSRHNARVLKTTESTQTGSHPPLRGSSGYE